MVAPTQDLMKESSSSLEQEMAEEPNADIEEEEEEKEEDLKQFKKMPRAAAAK